MSVREIRERIKDIAGVQGSPFFTAQVVKVEGSTCTIEYAGTKLTGVKLFSIGDGGKFIIKPLAGSMVTVADLSAGLRRDLCLIKIDQVEQMKLENENIVFDIDGRSGKFEIRSGNLSLAKLLLSLADIIKGLKVGVLSPNAPSGPIAPDSLALLNKFETDLKQLLKI